MALKTELMSMSEPLGGISYAFSEVHEGDTYPRNNVRRTEVDPILCTRLA